MLSDLMEITRSQRLRFPIVSDNQPACSPVSPSCCSFARLSCQMQHGVDILPGTIRFRLHLQCIRTMQIMRTSR